MFPIPARDLRDLIRAHPTKRNIFRFFAELSASLRRIALFESILASLIVATVALAVGRFFLIPWYYVLPAPAIYLLVRIVRIQRIDALGLTERAFPAFREQLITIRDNFHRTNEMELELEADVLSRSGSVESSGFFDPRGFSMRIITILLLFFVTGIFSQFTYQDVPPFWNAVFPSDPVNGGDPNFNFWQRSAVTGTSDSADLNSTDEIFGDNDPLIEGVDPVPIELEAARDALDLSTSTDVGEVETFERYTPTRLDVAGAEYFEETIPVSKHEIVQNYFRNQ